MARNLAADLESLRAEVRALSAAVTELQQKDGPTPVYNQKAGPQFHHASELQRLAETRGISGLVSYAGYYSSGSLGYRWETEAPAESLLNLDDDSVCKVLSALGNPQRLALLKAILTQPASVAELVDRLGMGTTGQVYHHLKSLQAADLVEQGERGQYVFRGHRVQSLLMLLAAVQDMIDTRYTAGTWDGDPEGERER